MDGQRRRQVFAFDKQSELEKTIRHVGGEFPPAIRFRRSVLRVELSDMLAEQLWKGTENGQAEFDEIFARAATGVRRRPAETHPRCRRLRLQGNHRRRL